MIAVLREWDKKLIEDLLEERANGIDFIARDYNRLVIAADTKLKEGCEALEIAEAMGVKEILS